MQTIFHYRVRAFVCAKGRVLLTRMEAGNYTFLPGGHIEMGEGAAPALEREIQEELGKACVVKKFLGAIENSWVDGDTRHHEINLVFEVDVPDLDPQSAVASQEKHIEFLWVEPDDFENLNLLPVPLRAFIKNWRAGDTSPWWGSSMA